MAFRSVISSRIPIVIILGATGTGKTKLSLELAQKFATEIISADSMQIYKGLDVVTAKASRQEREVAPHHLLDILDPHEIFTVVDFRDRALKIIDNLIQEKKIPIIVGGTNYYIESIVYKILVQKMDDDESLLWNKSRRKRNFDDEETSGDVRTSKKIATDTAHDDDSNDGNRKTELEIKTKKNCEENLKQSQGPSVDKTIEGTSAEISREQLKHDVDNDYNFTSEEIHSKLEAIDPVMAKRLHPNNRRKILRSIEVWLQTGRRHSDLLDEQKLSEGQLRRPDSTIILWLKCDQSVHEKRLDARVDTMLKQGLIEELVDFHARHNKHRIQDGKPPDYTKGIFQTLGFKEFHEYLMMTEEQRGSEEGIALMEQSIRNMRSTTKRYARRQNKIVRGRFLEHYRREIPKIYELDTTDLNKWDEQVKNKAITIIQSFLNESHCDYQPLQSEILEENKELDPLSNNYCDVCKRLIIGDKQYAIHITSNRHMKVIKKKKIEKQKCTKLSE